MARIVSAAKRLVVFGCLVIPLVGVLTGCTPAAYGVNETAVEQARNAGIPIVVDTVAIHHGRSNDTYLRLELTAIDQQSIAGLIIRSALIGADGSRLVNKSTGNAILELILETTFDFRHAGQWGPYFVGAYARCLQIDSVEVRLRSGRRIQLSRGKGLDAALAYTTGKLCL